MQAEQIYQEPEKLTVAKLKTELTKHGVPFPKTARKAEYVGLYRDRVQNNSGFSSDEDIIDIMSIGTANSLEVKTTIATEEFEDVAEEVPLRRSPRRKKKLLRLIEQEDFGQKVETSEKGTNVFGLEAEAADENIERARSNKVTVLLQKLLDDSMTISGTDIRELSDDELRLQLRKRGFDIGPIMKTTRSVYEKKLERALKNAESGDAGLEYSDEGSRSEEDEEEEEEPEPVVVETRRTRRSMLQRDEKGFSSAPNLTTLEYCQPEPISPPVRKPRDSHQKHGAPFVTNPLTPSWVNISMSDDTGVSKSFTARGERGPRDLPKRGFQSFNVLPGGYAEFQRGVHADELHQGGLHGDVPDESYVDVVNRTESTVFENPVPAEWSRMNLEVSGSSSTFDSVQRDMDETLEAPTLFINSTQLERPTLKTPVFSNKPKSHLTYDLLSPSVTSSAYSKRLKQICGSARRRRGMQTRDEAVQHEEPEEKETPKPPPVPVQTKQETLRPARRWVPVWMQILIVIFIALLVYLVAKTMEENPAKMIPRS